MAGKNDYIIFTDSGCDMSAEQLREWGVPYRCLSFRFDGDDTEYSNEDMPVEEFYDRMRRGGVAKTSAVNPKNFGEAFDKILASGRDILYLGFSSGISTTYNSAASAALALSEKYPERKLLTVDTLCASVGQGLLLYLTLKQKKQGASIEEAAAYAERVKLNVCHGFTVDDLVYLKRGGRVSPAVAFVGGVLGMKPLLKVDDEGKLLTVSKVRGRKSAISALVDAYGESAMDAKNGTVYIAHGSCMADAEKLSGLLRERYGASDILIGDVGPVIGSHTGPGILVLCFLGNHR